MIKWITAIIGAVFFKTPGAFAGFILGYFFELYKRQSPKNNKNIFDKKENLNPNDFELNLLSLSSIVIKADGIINQTELDYVRQYFVNAYGKERANATFRTFNEVIKNREISPHRICAFISQRTRYEARLQIIHFLFGIAKADGNVSPAEAETIQRMAGFMRVSFRDFESIKAMFFKTGDQAYKILEIDKSATDKEVKKAYRTMAKKYHPDKVQHMDEVHVKGAEAKFREVQKAYEEIQKQRGFI